MKKQKPIALIRTDGGNKIGMGHIFRSVALSQELKKKGFQIHFLITENKEIMNNLRKFGKCHFSSKNEYDEIDEIGKIEPEIIIIDLLKKFFPYEERYFKLLKKICKLLVTIDYSGKELEYVDLGFHSLFGPKKNRAKKTFFDLKYSIVKDDFIKESKNYKLRKIIKSILILQGGADTYCISPKIIKAVAKIQTELKISVVVGQSFKCWEEITHLKKNLGKKLTVLHDVDNIHKIMAHHQIVISAAGTTLTELLTIGIPTLVVYGQEHEKEMAEIVRKKKMAIILGNGRKISQKKISLATTKLLNDFTLRKYLSLNSKKNMKYNGKEKIVEIILKNYLKKAV